MAEITIRMEYTYMKAAVFVDHGRIDTGDNAPMPHTDNPQDMAIKASGLALTFTVRPPATLLLVLISAPVVAIPAYMIEAKTMSSILRS